MEKDKGLIRVKEKR